MLRKLLAGMLLSLFLFSSVASAAVPQDMTAIDKLSAVEKIIYGTEQTGSLVDRVGKLEKDVYGTASSDALLTKIDKLYSYISDNSAAAPSLLLKLNGIEWSITHTVTADPVMLRLGNLERSLDGSEQKGSVEDRLTKLMSLAYAAGQMDVSSTTINKDSLIKVQMVTPLDSRTSRVGDPVVFQAAEDVYVNGILVIAKGAQGTGAITKVEHAQNFGRDAVLTISYDTIKAIDGTDLNTFMGEKAKEQTKSMVTAAGASVAGMAILGPIGIVGGAFVHGKEITIPAGTQLYIQMKADTTVFGMKGQ
ncbi:Hypothetical protein LUCI_4587 [Lucifera butyrica]|uniref:Uncharacterized protein n=1 Tax=Lucifera butyrica TaxID=1351585 RepID=A0A498RED3_9FIRM|nr:hypothetical protein [Lucifera butyrica]VBB09297.1 Hypothetical protein LUCI_4587 [Lucifera butyrica]